MLHLSQGDKLFFRKIANKISKIGEIKTSYKNWVILDGIIMAIALMSIFWISGSIFDVLRENHLEPVIAAIVIFLTIYSIPKIAKIPDIVEISSRLYPQNIQRIYEVLELKKDEGVFGGIPNDLLVMPVNMFHDRIKKDGRSIPPNLVQRINWALYKIERLPRRQNWEA